MKKVLITWFKPFGSYIENPTERLCMRNQAKDLDDYYVLSQVFDTKILPNDGELSYGEAVVDRVVREDISAIISFGMWSDISGLRIETRATNLIDNQKYALPSEQQKQITNWWPEELFINLSHRDIDKIINSQNNIPVEPALSSNAWNFCCNAMIYNVLYAMQSRWVDLPFLFVHCSCTSWAIANILDFDKTKTLLTDKDLDIYLYNILSALKI